MKVFLHPSYLCKACFGRTLIKRLILQRVHLKYLPILVRSLPVHWWVNRWTRPKGITTYRKHRRYSNEVRGSRRISNFRQMRFRIFATSSSMEKERWSFSIWEIVVETPSLSNFSCTGMDSDMIDEWRNCDSWSFESPLRLTRQVDVLYACWHRDVSDPRFRTHMCASVRGPNRIASE